MASQQHLLGALSGERGHAQNGVQESDVVIATPSEGSERYPL